MKGNAPLMIENNTHGYGDRFKLIKTRELMGIDSS